MLEPQLGPDPDDRRDGPDGRPHSRHAPAQPIRDLLLDGKDEGEQDGADERGGQAPEHGQMPEEAAEAGAGLEAVVQGVAEADSAAAVDGHHVLDDVVYERWGDDAFRRAAEADGRLHFELVHDGAGVEPDSQQDEADWEGDGEDADEGFGRDGAGDEDDGHEEVGEGEGPLDGVQAPARGASRSVFGGFLEELPGADAVLIAGDEAEDGGNNSKHCQRIMLLALRL